MKNLIGKRALRTAPVTYSNGHKDWSYAGGSGVEIVNVTDTHVYIKLNHSDMVHALDAQWLDGNWTEFKPETEKAPDNKRWI